MIRWALEHNGPVAVRYAKAAAEAIARTALPVELGKAEVIGFGEDGCFIACGSMLIPCAEAAKRLAAEGVDFGVINARFVKPLDAATILAAVADTPLAVTVEEGVLMGGFGSTVLEAAADAGLDTSHLHRLGIPDRFIEHGPRSDLLADLGLDAAGIVRSCREWLGDRPRRSAASRVHA
jgi:1-deoxy-D-xylulose-5-phosphate synthase